MIEDLGRSCVRNYNSGIKSTGAQQISLSDPLATFASLLTVNPPAVDEEEIGSVMNTMNEVPARAIAPKLSEREVEVLRAWLICETKEAAGRSLYIGATTVSTHISRIRGKYEAVGRPAGTKALLLARALQDGLIAVDEL